VIVIHGGFAERPRVDQTQYWLRLVSGHQIPGRKRYRTVAA
jgi:hypothetical protein